MIGSILGAGLACFKVRRVGSRKIFGLLKLLRKLETANCPKVLLKIEREAEMDWLTHVVRQIRCGGDDLRNEIRFSLEQLLRLVELNKEAERTLKALWIKYLIACFGVFIIRLATAWMGKGQGDLLVDIVFQVCGVACASACLFSVGDYLRIDWFSDLESSSNSSIWLVAYLLDSRKHVSRCSPDLAETFVEESLRGISLRFQRGRALQGFAEDRARGYERKLKMVGDCLPFIDFFTCGILVVTSLVGPALILWEKTLVM